MFEFLLRKEKKKSLRIDTVSSVECFNFRKLDNLNVFTRSLLDEVRFNFRIEQSRRIEITSATRDQ